jgi:hypothetical protein
MAGQLSKYSPARKLKNGFIAPDRMPVFMPCMKNLSPIETLLCHILSNSFCDSRQIVQTPLENFFEIAASHGVLGVVYQKLHQQQMLHMFPEKVAKQWHCFVTQQAAVELQRDQIVQQILAAFAEQGICSLLIKGEGLARTVYTDPALRARGDTDFFIGADQIKKTVHLFSQLPGFCLAGAVYKKHQFLCHYAGKGMVNFNFDIHWRINNTARFAQILSFNEALLMAVALPGTEHGQTLCLEHALLLACIHLAAASRLTRERLIWYYDIHLLVLAMDETQWANFAQIAVAKNVQDICYSFLRRTANILGATVPEDVMRILSSSPVGTSLSKRIYQSNLGLLCCDFRELSAPSERLQLLAELFSPEPAFLLQEYNKKNPLWLPLLYIVYIGTRVYRRLTLK